MIKDLENYMDEGLEYKFKDTLFKVDNSMKAYINFKVKIDKLDENDKNYEQKMLEIILECAFGKEKSEKLKDLGLPLKVYLQIATEISEEWSGTKSNTPRKK